MARDFFINGETLVYVTGPTGSTIASTQEFGLAADPVRVTPIFRHRDINLDSWGGEVPADVQWMLSEVMVSFTLIHMDRAILDECLRLSMGGPSAIGQMSRAGTRMGNNIVWPNAGNKYIQLFLSSPIGAKPWRFFFSYLTNPPMEFPLGTEKSMVPVNWRVIPYPLASTSIPLGSDPANVQGSTILGATNYQLWSHI